MLHLTWRSVRKRACLLSTFSIALTAPLAQATEVAETLRVLGHRSAVDVAGLAAQGVALDDQALTGSGAALITDLLRELPSAAPSQAGALGGLTQLRLRGSEANHVLVRLDGFEANDPATGSEFDFSQLRTPTITGMALLSGATGALWGSDALAGVMEFQTLSSAQRHTELFLEGGERQRQGIALRLARGTERQGAALTLDRFETDGTNTARDGAENDGYRLDSLILKGHRALTDRLTLTGLLRQVARRSDVDPTPAPAFIPQDGDVQGRAQQRLLGVSLDYAGDRGEARFSMEQLASRYRDSQDGARTAQRRGDRLRLLAQGTLRLPNAPLGAAVATLALEQEQEGFDQLGEASAFGDPTQRQTLTHRSVLLSTLWHPADALRVHGTVRYDDNETFDSVTTGRLGAELELADNTVLWASAASAQKNPTFTERFGFTPNTFFGNAALRPEKSVAFEAGLRQGWPALGLSGSLVVHRARLEDEIDGFVFDGALGGFTAQNRGGESRRRGIEGLLAWTGPRGIALTGRYSVLRADEPVGAARRDELRRPKHQGALTASFAPGALPKVSGRLSVLWRGGLDDADFSTFPAGPADLDPLTLLRGQVSYHPRPGVTLSLLGENLLDQRYEALWGYAAPGRALYLRARLGGGG